jgi:hypothetical protein
LLQGFFDARYSVQEIVMSRDSRLFRPRARGPTSAVAALLIGGLAVTTSGAAQPEATPAAPRESAAEARDAGPRAEAEPRRERRRAARAEAAVAAAQPVEPAAAASAANTATAVEVSLAEPAFEDGPGSEIVCRTEQVLGTKIKKRVCATAAAWAELQRKTANNAGESMRQIHERSTIAPPTAAPPTAFGGQ